MMSRLRPFEARRAREQRVRVVMAEHHHTILRRMRRLGVADGDAHDAAQEVFFTFARRLVDVPVHRERSFLFATATRIAANWRRKRRPWREAPLDEASVRAAELDPEQLSQLLFARARLQQWLERWSAERRAVFVLCELEGMTAADAAELLGIAVGTVKTRLRAARELFRSSVRWLNLSTPSRQRLP